MKMKKKKILKKLKRMTLINPKKMTKNIVKKMLWEKMKS